MLGYFERISFIKKGVTAATPNKLEKRSVSLVSFR